jgi:hypothetical protein
MSPRSWPAVTKSSNPSRLMSPVAMALGVAVVVIGAAVGANCACPLLTKTVTVLPLSLATAISVSPSKSTSTAVSPLGLSGAVKLPSSWKLPGLVCLKTLTNPVPACLVAAISSKPSSLKSAVVMAIGIPFVLKGVFAVRVPASLRSIEIEPERLAVMMSLSPS